jgi:hypothetical protein
MIRIAGTPEAEPPSLVCPGCGETEHFDLRWVGNVDQTLTVDPEDGSRQYDAHDDEGAALNVDESLTCRRCGQGVAEREILVTVGPWQPPSAVALDLAVPSVRLVQGDRDTLVLADPDVGWDRCLKVARAMAWELGLHDSIAIVVTDDAGGRWKVDRGGSLRKIALAAV